MSDFNQIVLWIGTIVEENEIPEFEAWFKNELGFRVKYIESFKMEKSDLICVLFYIHNEDVPKFALFRIQTGDMKWFEDFKDNNPEEIPDEIWEKYQEYFRC